MVTRYSRSQNTQLDYGLLFSLFLLFVISLMAIYSASGQYNPDQPFYFVKRQIVWYIIGLVLMGIVMFVDYDLYKNFSIPLYIIGIGLLLLVEVFGVYRNGAQRWIEFGSFVFQPSEFVKIFMIVVLSSIIYKFTSDESNKPIEKQAMLTGKLILLTIVPFYLILQQPDLGTSLVIGAIMVVMIFISGVSWWIISSILATMAAGIATLSWLFLHHNDIFSKIIKSHQQDRIYGWLYPEEYLSSYGYQLMQAVYGIGAGQMYGTGFMLGAQSQSGRIPEIHTDFIFTIIGEEFGFIGVSIVISIYFLMIYRMMIIAHRCDNPFGTYLVTGVIGLLSFQIFQNIGMTVGLMPITGLALPFISYGGSALLTNMIAIGMVLNVSYRTKTYMFGQDEG